MAKPKPLTRAKLLEHLTVAMNRAVRQRDKLYDQHKGNINQPDYIRAKMVEQMTFRIICLANGHVDDFWHYVDGTLYGGNNNG